MNTPWILAAVRTPIGRLQGKLSSYRATELGAAAIAAALERAGVRPESVDEVILGNVLSAGVGQAPARQAALGAGLPPSVAALTVNKVCGSGLKAVMLAAQAIRAGDAEVIVAGGMESMSRAPWLLSRESPKLGDRPLVDSLMHDGLTCALSGRGMGDVAESLAARDGITRDALDRYAAESHRKALAAYESGAFDDEVVPLRIACDEGPRAESTAEKLASLPPAFAKSGVITAGNASMISDGAAAVVVASQSFAERQQLRPRAKILSYATSGGPPEELFTAPVAAIQSAVERAGLRLADIDLVELNEAFAVQMLACLARLDIAPEKVNVHGGAIALGHPIGASGARILATLVHAVQRRQARYGVAALCLGGGNAVALVVEAVHSSSATAGK
jgi:acetyl-CoA C-acetyltransferase